MKGLVLTPQLLFDILPPMAGSSRDSVIPTFVLTNLSVHIFVLIHTFLASYFFKRYYKLLFLNLNFWCCM